MSLEEMIADVVRRTIREELATLRAPAPEVMTVEQAAAHTGRAPKTIRGWVGEGRLVATRHRRRLAIRREDLERAVAGEADAPANAAAEAWQRMRRAG